jgi:putative 4-mercaptohistidine N1-methyltranferase
MMSSLRRIQKPITMILAAQASWVRCASQECAPVVRSTASSGSQVYESERAVSEYLLFHFGADSDMMPYKQGPKEALNFPQRLAELGAAHASNKGRALDLGCSVGGAAFQLSEHFDEVVGVDFSNHFVDAANKMKTEKTMAYSILESGTNFVPREATLPANARPDRVTFAQGDATDMQASLGKFDLIVASNLLCRLPKPALFLDKVAEFLNTGGVLLLVSPYSWLDEYTPVKDWLGAKDGQHSYDAIKAYVKKNKLPLVQTHQEDISFLIREHARKFQYGVSDAVVFKKV